MPRSGRVKKRSLLPDAIYKSRTVARFINYVMKSGKKTLALAHVYGALSSAAREMNKGELEILRQALDNIKPMMEVRSRRVGGAAYQIPVPVKGDRREALAMRWLVQAARTRPNKQYHTFTEKLAAELISACRGEGEAVKKKENIHRMAEANKAFAHFRW